MEKYVTTCVFNTKRVPIYLTLHKKIIKGKNRALKKKNEQ